MAKTEKKTEQPVEKLKIDNSYSARLKTERVEFRCSKNLKVVIEGLQKVKLTEHQWRDKSAADVITIALKELAEKHKLFRIGDTMYL